MANHTMKKDFRLAVRKEILDSLSDDYGTTEGALEFLLTEFKGWKSYSAPKMNHQEAFKQFLMCLPSSFNAEYTYHGISDVLKKWFASVGVEYKERDSEAELNHYTGLLYRELPYVFKEYGMVWSI